MAEDKFELARALLENLSEGERDILIGQLLGLDGDGLGGEARGPKTAEEEQSLLYRAYRTEQQNKPLGVSGPEWRKNLRDKYRRLGLRGVDGLPPADGKTQAEREAESAPPLVPEYDPKTLRAKYLEEVEAARAKGGVELARAVRAQYRRLGLRI